ncbi:MAG TPA: hypothetical protein VFA33_11810 [Bryobacteraceae bacterium]|nr:hypothetical protein [Bryobacteraceae bacterium]
MAGQRQTASNAPLAAVQDCLCRARLHLVQPDARHLESGRALLEEAAGLLQAVPGTWAAAGPQNLQERRLAIASVRRDLVQLRSLLDAAASFYLGWGGLRSSLGAGYTPRGIAADFPISYRLSLAG